MQGSQPSPLRNLVHGGNSTTTITFQILARDFRRNPLCGSIPCRSSGSLSSAVKILRTRSWLGQRLGLVFFSHSRTSIPGSAFVMVSRCLESSKRFCVYYLDLIRERIIRRVEIDGMADNEFRRIHGIGKNAPKMLCVS